MLAGLAPPLQASERTSGNPYRASRLVCASTAKQGAFSTSLSGDPTSKRIQGPSSQRKRARGRNWACRPEEQAEPLGGHGLVNQLGRNLHDAQARPIAAASPARSAVGPEREGRRTRRASQLCESGGSNPIDWKWRFPSSLSS
ncbi:uncharacterized protein A4U43_C01F1670 [Asparagus officinalis]|uniref:Uncharacterized protein n=1 Tax=Asparagus officinalis TaxID=4686 RepID=A0A5P1FML7_ASPOF|nr:uncharacterized protein A4U43_C01F1670 [Asparagus officinalis]